jgi:hypothetical protein
VKIKILPQSQRGNSVKHSFLNNGQKKTYGFTLQEKQYNYIIREVLVTKPTIVVMEFQYWYWGCGNPVLLNEPLKIGQQLLFPLNRISQHVLNTSPKTKN